MNAPEEPSDTSPLTMREEQMAALLRVIAHPVRLMILSALCERSHCVKDINALLPGVPQPNLSQHMGALRKAGLVADHKDGFLRCYYLLQPSLVAPLIDLLTRDHEAVRRDKQSVQAEARSGLNNP